MQLLSNDQWTMEFGSALYQWLIVSAHCSVVLRIALDNTIISFATKNVNANIDSHLYARKPNGNTCLFLLYRRLAGTLSAKGGDFHAGVYIC